MSDKFPQYVFAKVSVLAAIGLIAASAIFHDAYSIAFLVFAAVMMFLAYGVLTGQLFQGIKLGFGDTATINVGFREPTPPPPRAKAEPIQPRILDENEVAEKQKHAEKIKEEHKLPGQNAPRFSAVSSIDDLLIRPSAHPMTPMYLLDNMYRIIDWNEAFTIAFDRTMEGRKGRGVLEWTYFLDNYEEVLDHGVKAFADANQLPVIDVEDINYTSLRYGKLSATKRAYQIPDNSGACLAWLVTLDLKFSDPKQQAVYQQDLIRHLGLDLMWSEYAISYDRVLNNTRAYPALLGALVGGHDGIGKIPQGARILDLGAGTGNLAYKLITTGPNRVIFAVENNRIMLQILRMKCQDYLRSGPDTNGGGVITIKQDITSLFGLDDDYFDFAFMNNVLHAVEDAEACLKEVYRVLKPNGELRLSGPRKDPNLQILFDCFANELKEANKFLELQSNYEHVLQINRLKLGPWLYRWTTKEVEAMLLKVGFSKIVYSSDQHYANQSMLICAVK